MIFDLIEIVLSMKLKSLGCTMVTLGSETLFYISTPHPNGIKVLRINAVGLLGGMYNCTLYKFVAYYKRFSPKRLVSKVSKNVAG